MADNGMNEKKESPNHDDSIQDFLKFAQSFKMDDLAIDPAMINDLINFTDTLIFGLHKLPLSKLEQVDKYGVELYNGIPKMTIADFLKYVVHDTLQSLTPDFYPEFSSVGVLLEQAVLGALKELHLPPEAHNDSPSTFELSLKRLVSYQKKLIQLNKKRLGHRNQDLLEFERFFNFCYKLSAGDKNELLLQARKDPEFPGPIWIRKILVATIFFKVFKLLFKLAQKDYISTWKEMFEIGFLYGKLGQTDLLLDPELKKIHHEEKSGEKSKIFWANQRKIQEEKEKPVIEEIKRIAEDRWGEKKRTMLHNQMAKHICGQLLKAHPELAGKTNLNNLVFRTLRPIARKYNRLRGVPIPELPGTIEKVNLAAESIIVKCNEGKKLFSVKGTPAITKGGSKMSLTDLQKGMNVLIRYRNEKGEMVATEMKVTTYPRQIRRK